jgi:hypothetical protein
MTSRIASALVLTALFIGCAARAEQRPNTFLTQAVSTALLERFAQCVGPTGPRMQLPVAVGELKLKSAYTIPLSEPGIVSDGYYHWLVLSNASDTAFIVQSGGIAGERTVFGPFNVALGCKRSPAIVARRGGASALR